MGVLRLQHVGTASRTHASAAERLGRVGLAPSELRADQGRGFQLDSRALLGNECWLHVVHNWNPEARVCRFLRERGEGLEHVAFETDDIEGAVEHLRRLGVPLFEDRIIRAADGFEAFVYPEHACGFTIELIQPHPESWNFPNPPPARVSPMLRATRLMEVVAVSPDPEAAAARLRLLFGLEPGPADAGGAVLVALPNRCVIRLERTAGSSGAAGLEALALATADIESDRATLQAADVPVVADPETGDVRIPASVAGFELRLRPETRRPDGPDRKSE